jgi:hypothetical protein
MKTYLIMIICLYSIGLKAQSMDEKKITDAVERFRIGIESANKEILEAVAADNLVYGHSSGKVQNKAEFVAEIVGGKPLDYVAVQISDQTIQISGTVAVVRHVFTAQITNNGAPGDLKIGNMLIWQKQHGKWKLLARQAYKL